MTDCLVIGGGVAGLSAAAALAPHCNVTLLEAETALGYHASGRSAALFEPNYGAPTVQALSRASEGHHRDGGYLSPRGFLLLGEETDNALFEQDMQALGCTEITPAEAAQKVPILKPGKITRAAFHKAAEDIDTDKLLQDFAKTVRAHDGAVRTGHRITAIDKTASGWTVRTEQAEFAAPRLINAAGAWADQIAQLARVKPVGLTPLRRSMARIAAPGGHDVSRWPMFFGAGETWYAKPDAGGLIVSPADEDPCAASDAWPEDMTLAEGLARYQDYVTPEVTRPLATWAGLRSFAPDRTLVLGPDPADTSFIWSAGQGGYGFQTGPAAGQLVADLTLGLTPRLATDTVAALSPARFASAAENRD